MNEQLRTFKRKVKVNRQEFDIEFKHGDAFTPFQPVEEFDVMDDKKRGRVIGEMMLGDPNGTGYYQVVWEDGSVSGIHKSRVRKCN